MGESEMGENDMEESDHFKDCNYILEITLIF